MSGGSATENVIMMKIIMTMMVMIMMMMTMMMMITSGGSATENMIDHDCNGWSDMFTMTVMMIMKNLQRCWRVCNDLGSVLQSPTCLVFPLRSDHLPWKIGR